MSRVKNQSRRITTNLMLNKNTAVLIRAFKSLKQAVRLDILSDFLQNEPTI